MDVSTGSNPTRTRDKNRGTQRIDLAGGNGRTLIFPAMDYNKYPKTLISLAPHFLSPLSVTKAFSLSRSAMSSSEASDLSMKFKSKKPLTLTPKSKPGSVISDPILTAPTPDRPWQPAPPRVRNRNVALSIADIRRAAVKSVGEKKDQSGSARRQIAFQEESPKKKKAPKKLPEK